MGRMVRLTAEPQGVIARRYRVARDGQTTVEIGLPPFGPSTMTPLAGVTYQMRRVGVWRAVYTMATEGSAPVARATRRHAIGSREYEIVVGTRRFLLRAKSPLSNAYRLMGLSSDGWQARRWIPASWLLPAARR